MDIFITLFLLLFGAGNSNYDDNAAFKKLASVYVNTIIGEPVLNSDLQFIYEPKPSVKKDPQPDAPKIKGIYVTAHSAGGSRMSSLLELVDNTELNSMVIDVKDDNGYITFAPSSPELLEYGGYKKYIPDITVLMNDLRSHHIYPIARIVVFKDTILAVKNPHYSFTQKNGTIWKNNKGEAFVNPTLKEVWEYNVAVAKEAAMLGFKEIQFDYMRFPEGFDNIAEVLNYENANADRVEAVTGFIKYAREQLEPLGVRVSVDIFGYAASVPTAEGIGQDFTQLSNNAHVISPMIYPSHYSTGWFNLKAPDRNPYSTIAGAIKDTHKKLENSGDLKPVIRPWIQDFTASWLGKGNYLKYGKTEVEAQIKALKDNGITEYLIWNAGNKYSPGVNYD